MQLPISVTESESLPLVYVAEAPGFAPQLAQTHFPAGSARTRAVQFFTSLFPPGVRILQRLY